MSTPDDSLPRSTHAAVSRRRFLETSAGIAGAVGLADPAATQAAEPKPVAGKTPESPTHPLDPLTADEIVRAVEIVRQARRVNDAWRFVTVTLAEPSKDVVRSFKPGTAIPRQAFVIGIDRGKGEAYEGIVDLVEGTVERFDALPAGIQPPISLDEFTECEEAIKRSPEFLAALKKRGASDVQLVMVDPWSAGMYGTELPEEKGKRLSRA